MAAFSSLSTGFELGRTMGKWKGKAVSWNPKKDKSRIQMNPVISKWWHSRHSQVNAAIEISGPSCVWGLWGSYSSLPIQEMNVYHCVSTSHFCPNETFQRKHVKAGVSDRARFCRKFSPPEDDNCKVGQPSTNISLMFEWQDLKLFELLEGPTMSNLDVHPRNRQWLSSGGEKQDFILCFGEMEPIVEILHNRLTDSTHT